VKCSGCEAYTKQCPISLHGVRSGKSFLPAPYINYFGTSHPVEQHQGEQEEEESLRNVLETYYIQK
jgi:hypothetical protein